MTTDPTVRSQNLGEKLRALRESTSCTLGEAAKRIGASVSKVSRIETGHGTACPEDVASLLVVYGVTGSKRSELLELTREAERRGWWQRNRPEFSEHQRPLVMLESRADHIDTYEATVVPGLLQTPEYTRSIMLECGYIPEDEVDLRTVRRLQRQNILTCRDPVALVAYLDELALHRLVGGGHDVLRHQLTSLIKSAGRPNITIRIVPNDGSAHAGIDGSFMLLRNAESTPVVFAETLTSSLFFEEQREIEQYTSVLRRLADRALDQAQSVELIETLTSRLDTTGRTHAHD